MSRAVPDADGLTLVPDNDDLYFKLIRGIGADSTNVPHTESDELLSSDEDTQPILKRIPVAVQSKIPQLPPLRLRKQPQILPAASLRVVDSLDLHGWKAHKCEVDLKQDLARARLLVEYHKLGAEQDHCVKMCTVPDISFRNQLEINHSFKTQLEETREALLQCYLLQNHEPMFEVEGSLPFQIQLDAQDRDCASQYLQNREEVLRMTSIAIRVERASILSAESRILALEEKLVHAKQEFEMALMKQQKREFLFRKEIQKNVDRKDLLECQEKLLLQKEIDMHWNFTEVEKVQKSVIEQEKKIQAKQKDLDESLARISEDKRKISAEFLRLKEGKQKLFCAFNHIRKLSKTISVRKRPVCNLSHHSSFPGRTNIDRYVAMVKRCNRKTTAFVKQQARVVRELNYDLCVRETDLERRERNLELSIFDTAAEMELLLMDPEDVACFESAIDLTQSTLSKAIHCMPGMKPFERPISGDCGEAAVSTCATQVTEDLLGVKAAVSTCATQVTEDLLGVKAKVSTCATQVTEDLLDDSEPLLDVSAQLIENTTRTEQSRRDLFDFLRPHFGAYAYKISLMLAEYFGPDFRFEEARSAEILDCSNQFVSVLRTYATSMHLGLLPQCEKMSMYLSESFFSSHFDIASFICRSFDPGTVKMVAESRLQITTIASNVAASCDFLDWLTVQQYMLFFRLCIEQDTQIVLQWKDDNDKKETARIACMQEAGVYPTETMIQRKIHQWIEIKLGHYDYLIEQEIAFIKKYVVRERLDGGAPKSIMDIFYARYPDWKYDVGTFYEFRYVRGETGAITSIA